MRPRLHTRFDSLIAQGEAIQFRATISQFPQQNHVVDISGKSAAFVSRRLEISITND